jgi:hypothetical protein
MGTFVKQQLLERLLATLPLQGRRQNETKHRKFLIDCIESHGYIKKRNVKSEIEPVVEVATQTYFKPTDSYSERLAILQQRGITYEESELGKVNEIMDTALNEMFKENFSINVESIKNVAMNYYIDILDYYKTNPDSFKKIYGSLKKGYIALCVYYAMPNTIDKETLARYFKYSVSDFFEAEKNMKVIFKNKLQKKSIELCGMKKVLLENFDQSVINKIEKVINDIPVKNKKNIAAAIYFVTSIPIAKGGIFSKKLKLKNGDYLTLEFISKFCKIVPSTISSAKDEIIFFYKNNPGSL